MTDSVARAQLIASEKWGMLLFLIDRSNDDEMKVNTALSLSKLAVLNESVRLEVLNDHFLIQLVLKVLESSLNVNNLSLQKICLETISHLSMHHEIKTFLVDSNFGFAIKSILSMIPTYSKDLHFDTLILYAVLQIICNLCTSANELDTSHEELEQLKKAASKGLNVDKYQKLPAERAGNAELIESVRRALVLHGLMTCLYHILSHLFKGFTLQKLEVSNAMVENIAKVFMVLSSTTSNRGLMVQQGALTILLYLFDLTYTELREVVDHASSPVMLPWMRISTALSRVLMSTNPALIPRTISLSSLIRPLAVLIDRADHEIYQFEALIALTNIVSVQDDSIEACVMSEHVWSIVRSALGSSTVMLQRAAIECLSNLTMMPLILEKLEKDVSSEDIKLFVLFSKSDDVPSQLAALGALAMISSSNVIARRLIELDYHSFIRQIKQLSNHFGPDLMQRVDVIAANLSAIFTFL